jgi:hypothetical protein
VWGRRGGRVCCRGVRGCCRGMRPRSRCQHRVEVLRLLSRCQSRGRGVNAAVEVSRPAHVFLLLLNTAVKVLRLLSRYWGRGCCLRPRSRRRGVKAGSRLGASAQVCFRGQGRGCRGRGLEAKTQLSVIQQLFVVVCDCLPLCANVLPCAQRYWLSAAFIPHEEGSATLFSAHTTTKYNTAAANKSV